MEVVAPGEKKIEDARLNKNQKGVKVISLANRPPFTHLEAEWTPAP